MSTTLSSARPARSPTPVLNEEDAELQAFLAAAQREAQEKWRRLREEKASGNVVDERKVVEEKEVVEEDVDGVVEVEKEIVPKVEPKPRKEVLKMVAGMPRSRYSGPEGMMSRAYGGGVEPLRSWSIPIQIPSWSRFPVPANELFFPPEIEEAAGSIPPDESDQEEKRELHHAIEELTVQVRTLVRQGQKGREGRGDRRDDRKGKGKRRKVVVTFKEGEDKEDKDSAVLEPHAGGLTKEARAELDRWHVEYKEGIKEIAAKAGVDMHACFTYLNQQPHLPRAINCFNAFKVHYAE
ncbi:hypothetical protein GGU11DRAFT_826568, partial [Lentinula aff. detonsa]